MAFSKSTAKRTGSSSGGHDDDNGLSKCGPGGATKRTRQGLYRIVGKATLRKSTKEAAVMIVRSKQKNSPRGRLSSAEVAQEVAQEVRTKVGRTWRLGQPAGFTVRVHRNGTYEINPLPRKPARQKDSDALSDALEQARERGKTLAAAIMSQDDMLNAAEFGDLVGASRVTVSAWRQAHRVLGLAGAKRGYRFPAWQLDENGKPYDAIPKLFERLGDGPWAVYRFLVQPHPGLDGLTGQEALKAGRSEDVLAVAESAAQGAFS